MKTRWKTMLFAPCLAAAAGIACAQQAVILVRHAELQGAAMAEPKNLPLSEAGAQRAQRLASVLKDSGVSAIYVTDFARTQETADPLAKALGQQPTVLPKGDPKEMAERLRARHGTQTVLLVGHTDTLPGLMRALGYPADVKIEAQDYGNIFVLAPRAGAEPTLVRLRY
jgi:broad specificity phosphatase PhoE